MNTIEANDLQLFARVVDEGSFSRAGERLGLPKSTVSRRLAALEAQLGERLLLRTTRKFKLTDFGHSVLEHARHVSDEVNAAAQLAQHRQVQPSGRLRVTMPGDLADLLLAQMLSDFVANHPAITLELDLTPRRVDLIGENYDLAIRMGDLPDDASLVARRLATFSHSLYAAPAYLARRGTPSEPEALMEHDSVQILGRNGEPLPWELRRGAERWTGVPPVRARANSPGLLARLACAGAGIVAANDHFAEPYVQRGDLVPLLVDWDLPPTDAWAVFPGRRLVPARTRVFLDAIQAVFQSAPCRAAEAQAAAVKADRVRRLQSTANVTPA